MNASGPLYGLASRVVKMNEMNEKICAPSCEHCGEPMTFERMTPKSALIPELRTFVCSECGDIETIEVITVREGEDESTGGTDGLTSR